VPPPTNHLWLELLTSRTLLLSRPSRRRRRGWYNAACAAMSATNDHGLSMAAQAHPATASTSDTPPAADTSSCRKEPPPERPSDSRRRSLVILSFWLVVLCLGLPIWWKTTTIPRASLPLDDMMDWAAGKVRRAPPTQVTLTTHTHASLPWLPCPQDLEAYTCADLHTSPRPAAQSSPFAYPSRRASCRTRKPRTCCA
jgi:hypothetical protein